VRCSWYLHASTEMSILRHGTYRKACFAMLAAGRQDFVVGYHVYIVFQLLNIA